MSATNALLEMGDGNEYRQGNGEHGIRTQAAQGKAGWIRCVRGIGRDFCLPSAQVAGGDDGTDAEASSTPQLAWAVREGIDMNDPSVALSCADTAQTSAAHGRALLFTGFAWLSIAVIALRFTRAPTTADVLAFLAGTMAG